MDSNANDRAENAKKLAGTSTLGIILNDPTQDNDLRATIRKRYKQCVAYLHIVCAMRYPGPTRQKVR